MVGYTAFNERLGSLPNTQYMTLIGILVIAAAVGLEVFGLSVEAGLTLSLGLFFVVLGLLSHAIFWTLGVIETSRL